jgi:soluble lytic murein transglycosylase-like protein
MLPDMILNYALWWMTKHPPIPGVPNLVSTAAETVSRHYGIPAPLLLAVAEVESRFHAHAISPCGARGIMQIMPSTARLLHIRDVFNIEDSMRGAAKYLMRLTWRFGSVKQAIFAYNTGHAGTPWQVNHSGYVQAVLHDYQQIMMAS